MVLKISSFLLLFFALLSPIVLASSCDETKTIIQGNYSNESLTDNRLQNWYVSRPNIPQDSISLVPAPYNPSVTTVKFVSKKGDSWNNLGYPRSELDMSPYFTFELGKIYTISTAFYFDPASAFGTKELLALFQVHHEGNGSPPVAIFLENGNLFFSQRPGPYERNTISNYGAIPLGRRVGLKIEYKPDTTQSGFIKYYFNDSLVNEFSGQTMYPGSPNGGYLKQGIYDYNSSITDSATVFMEATSISETTQKNCPVIVPVLPPVEPLQISSQPVIEPSTIINAPPSTVSPIQATESSSSVVSVSSMVSSTQLVEPMLNAVNQSQTLQSSVSSKPKASSITTGVNNSSPNIFIIVISLTMTAISSVFIYKMVTKLKLDNTKKL
jgi:Polysaccharide lyase